jgi:hypothetical protein
MDLNSHMIAHIVHDANRAYCEVHDDMSQKTWGFAPQWQQDSAVAGVEAVRSNPEITPEELHKSWIAEKIRTGWTYGHVKDPIAKTHPCLVPYGQLPEFQRRKDALFRAIVLALI